MQRICCRSRLRTTSEAASSRSAALRVRLVVFPWTFVPCTFLGAGERGGCGRSSNLSDEVGGFQW